MNARQQPVNILIAVAILLTWVSTASAGEVERDRGFYIALALQGSYIGQDPEPGSLLMIDENGGGMDLRFGYSFNPVFSLELTLGGAAHETNDVNTDMGFGEVRLFAHYRFMPGQAVRPYVKGGIGAYALTLKQPDIEVTASGGGLPFGGGVDYFFNRHFSLGADFTFNVIQYNNIDVKSGPVTLSDDINEDGSQASLALTFGWYF